MYPTGSHTSGLLRKEICFFAFCPYPIVPQMTENEKKRLSNKLKPSTTTTGTSQNQLIFKTQINV